VHRSLLKFRQDAPCFYVQTLLGGAARLCLSAANLVKPAARPFGLVARHGQVSQFTHDRQNVLYSRRSGVAQVG